MWKLVQDEVTHQRLRVGSKKPVQSCPESLEGKAAAIFTRGAYAEYVSAHDAKSAKSVRPKGGNGVAYVRSFYR